VNGCIISQKQIPHTAPTQLVGHLKGQTAYWKSTLVVSLNTSGGLPGNPNKDVVWLKRLCQWKAAAADNRSINAGNNCRENKAPASVAAINSTVHHYISNVCLAWHNMPCCLQKVHLTGRQNNAIIARENAKRQWVFTASKTNWNRKRN